MKAHVVAQISIKAKPAAVFPYLSELRYHYFWNPSLIDLSPVKTLRPGTAYKSTSILLGIKVQCNNKVSKLDENSELEIENITGPLQYRVNYSLQPQTGKTMLVCTTEVSAESEAFAFARPVLKLL